MDTVEKIVNDSESRRYPSELIKQRIDALLNQLEERLKEAYEFNLTAANEASYEAWLEAEKELRKASITLNWLFTS